LKSIKTKAKSIKKLKTDEAAEKIDLDNERESIDNLK
jgi:hypothetical protein